MLRETSRTTVLPVSVDDLKLHLRIASTAIAGGSSAEDALLESYEMAAIRRGENLTRRAWMRTKWELTLDSFPTGQMVLPRPPLTTISTEVIVTYIDPAAAVQTLGATGYGIDERSEPGSLIPSTESSEDWPDTNDVFNAVTVTFFSGYATATTNVIPESIQQWIRLQVGQMYEFREPVADGSLNTQRRDFLDGLLDPYIVF